MSGSKVVYKLGDEVKQLLASRSCTECGCDSFFSQVGEVESGEVILRAECPLCGHLREETLKS